MTPAEFKVLDIGQIRKLIIYDPLTGMLTWLPRPVEMFPSERYAKIWNTKNAGKPALNCVRDHGYLGGNIFGKFHYAHRVAWAIETGEWPEQIDHDNGDRTDNRWVNMIEGNQSGNMKNSAQRSDNLSGVTGVSWDKRRKMWYARVKEHGRNRNLGYYHCIAHASMVRHQIAREMGFSERHGS